MSDHAFEFQFAPAAYPDRVQRAAVLYPLTGFCGTDDAVRMQTAKLVWRWRARLSNLGSEGWRPGHAASGMQFARNCCPAFAYSLPRTKPCNQRLLCPFCYARWVREVWLTVEQAYHGPSSSATWTPRNADVAATCDHQLIERHVYFRMSLAPPGHDPNDPAVLAQRARYILKHAASVRAEFVQSCRPVGAFAFTTLEPARRGWRIHNRQLLMVPQSRPLAELPLKVSPGTKVRIHVQPTRSTLLGAVSRVCRYPKLLLLGDPYLTVKLLEAKRAVRARLSATYGVFRGGTTDV